MYETDLSEWLPVMGYIIFLVTITAIVLARTSKQE